MKAIITDKFLNSGYSAVYKLFQAPKKSENKILLLGFKGSGKNKLISCLSNRLEFSNEFILTSIELPQGDNVKLYSIDPEKYSQKSLKPILNAIKGAVILVDPNLASAIVNKQLGFLFDCCKKQQITSIAIGVWNNSNVEQFVKLDKIYAFLNNRNLTLPVVIIENSNRDDIAVLVESACASLAFG